MCAGVCLAEEALQRQKSVFPSGERLTAKKGCKKYPLGVKKS